jgi:hypothetical protein
LPVGKAVVDYDTIERARGNRGVTPPAPLPPVQTGSV